MNLEAIEQLEVKPKEKGWYFVTLFQYEKIEPKNPDYIKDWVEFDGENWVYDGYEGCCYVCFISKKEE